MIILPAIDIKDKQCVRLYKGDFSTVEQVAENPFTTAESFVTKGAKWIHMVDLDGAKTGTRVNSDIFTEIAQTIDARVELGGGIREIKTVEYYLERGISRVILGSAAVQSPQFVKEAVKAFGENIAVGIDAKNEMVAAQGWLETSNIHYIDLAKRMEDIGVRCIIYTDISKDGTLEGANLTQLASLQKAVSCDIIASGGIRDIEDIKKLRQMEMYGAICGKSIYKGTLCLREAIKTAEE